MDLPVALIPIGAALIGMALGFVVAHWGALWVGWALSALGLGAAVLLAIIGDGRPGLEGLGHVLVAVMAVAPAGLGAAFGTVIATIRARQR